MKRLLLICALLMPAAPLYAQPEAPAAAATVEAAKPTEDAKPTAAEVVKEVADVAEAVEGVKDAKTTGEGMALAIMALLVAVFKLLLSGLKLSGPFWKGRRGKTLLRILTITFGVGAALVSSAMDVGWFQAVVIGMSGPLSVALHEYSILIPALAKKKDAAKADA